MTLQPVDIAITSNTAVRTSNIAINSELETVREKASRFDLYYHFSIYMDVKKKTTK